MEGRWNPEEGSVLIEWKESYSVGVPVFDGQHQQLFKLINDLHVGMSNGEGQKRLGEILAGLLNYTKTHFTAEEAALAKAGYRDLAAHKKLHREFEGKIESFGNDLRGGKLCLSTEVMSFLNDWLLNHIKKVDKGYGPLLAPQRVLAGAAR